MSNNSECKTRLLPYPHSNSHSKFTSRVQVHVSKPEISWETDLLQGLDDISTPFFAHEGMCFHDPYALHQDLDSSFNTSWNIRTLCWEVAVIPLRISQAVLETNHLEHSTVADFQTSGTFHFTPTHALNKKHEILLRSWTLAFERPVHWMPCTCWKSARQRVALLSRRQMFDLKKIYTMGSWWDASFWIHPDFICCSFARGGHSNHSVIFSTVICSSQCPMELRCIDWYMNLPTRATWLQERHCCKQ